MLYRATYLRNGLKRAVTFHADGLMELCDFISLWERCAKVVISSWEKV